MFQFEHQRMWSNLTETQTKNIINRIGIDVPTYYNIIFLINLPFIISDTEEDPKKSHDALEDDDAEGN